MSEPKKAGNPRWQKGVSGNPNGRPRKSDKYATPISNAEKQIADQLPHLINKLFELAEGITVQETDKDGKEIIYTRAPDLGALKYLVDRVMGKPTERKEMQLTTLTPDQVAQLSDEELDEHLKRRGLLT